jgi:hypothetical protein
LPKIIIRASIGSGIREHIDQSTGKTVKIETFDKSGRRLDVQHISPDTGHPISRVHFDASTGEVQKIVYFDVRSGQAAWIEFFDLVSGARTRVEQIERGPSRKQAWCEVLEHRLAELAAMEMIVFHEAESLKVDLDSRRVLERVRTRLYHELQHLVSDIGSHHPEVVRDLKVCEKLARMKQPLKGA